jgi:hypothetical protein
MLTALKVEVKKRNGKGNLGSSGTIGRTARRVAGDDETELGDDNNGG